MNSSHMGCLFENPEFSTGVQTCISDGTLAEHRQIYKFPLMSVLLLLTLSLQSRCHPTFQSLFSAPVQSHVLPQSLTTPVGGQHSTGVQAQELEDPALNLILSTYQLFSLREVALPPSASSSFMESALYVIILWC